MEPNDASEYNLTIKNYNQAIFKKNSRGAIMMGVCRGRISEGLDFSDKLARCVMVVGIPFP